MKFIMSENKRFIHILFLGVISLSSGVVQAQWFSYSGAAMTTLVEMKFWDNDSVHAERLSQKVFAEFERIDNSMSRYKAGSELSKVNRLASQQAVPISNELFSVLKKAQNISDLSKGAFDITFASLGYLYDFRRDIQPDKISIKALLPKINYRHLILSQSLPQSLQYPLQQARQTASFSEPGVILDLGGIAKGYTVDKAIEILQRNGITNARLSAGGDMRFLGDKRGKPWMVGIKDPRAQDKYVVVLPLSNISISTSGDYERFFIDDKGKRIHHILSPKTGRPAEGMQGVSVIGPDTITSDGLSTAIFVLGVEKGLAMIERLEGIDAIIIDEQHKIFFSKGLMPPKKFE